MSKGSTPRHNLSRYGAGWERIWGNGDEVPERFVNLDADMRPQPWSALNTNFRQDGDNVAGAASKSCTEPAGGVDRPVTFNQ